MNAYNTSTFHNCVHYTQLTFPARDYSEAVVSWWHFNLNMRSQKSDEINPVWGKAPAASRGPKPRVSTNQIVQTAIRLADKEGLAAVTMQGLARKMGLTTMAMYRYFYAKSDLIAFMIDSVSAPPPNFGRPSLPWNTRLKEWAHCCLAIYTEHPWFLEATSSRQSVMGPNELLWLEAALAILGESGLSSKEWQHSFLAIIGHVRGHATFQQVGASPEARKAWDRELARMLRTEAHLYPILLDVVRTGGFSESLPGAFEFGLDFILEGIRARVSGWGR